QRRRLYFGNKQQEDQHRVLYSLAYCRVSNSVERRGNPFLPFPPMTKTPESGMLTAAHRHLSSIMGGRSDHLEGGRNSFVLKTTK
ncbi:unnamed protein product, partial [Hymenolepis diminuta]